MNPSVAHHNGGLRVAQMRCECGGLGVRLEKSPVLYIVPRQGLGEPFEFPVGPGDCDSPAGYPRPCDWRRRLLIIYRQLGGFRPERRARLRPRPRRWIQVISLGRTLGVSGFTRYTGMSSCHARSSSIRTPSLCSQSSSAGSHSWSQPSIIRSPNSYHTLSGMSGESNCAPCERRENTSWPCLSRWVAYCSPG